MAGQAELGTQAWLGGHLSWWPQSLALAPGTLGLSSLLAGLCTQEAGWGGCWMGLWSPGSGSAGGAILSPVLQVTGAAALRSTTLQSLGLSGGSATVR